VHREPVDAWRRLTLVPIGALVGAVLVLAVTGWAIEASGLEQREDSWGFVAGAVILAFVSLGPMGLTISAAALVRSFDPAWVSVVGGWAGAVVSALCGVVLASLVVPPMGLSPADTVFGVVALVVAALLLVPLGACWRLARRSRQRESAVSTASS
jgi:hypothetical protein